MRHLGSFLLVFGVAAAAPVANNVYHLESAATSTNECAAKCHLDDGPCLLKCMHADDKTCLAGCSNDNHFHSCVSACVKMAFPSASDTVTPSQNSSCFDQGVCYNSCEFQHGSYCNVYCNYEYYWNCQHACGVDCPASIKTTNITSAPLTGRPALWLKSCAEVAGIGDHGHPHGFNSYLESPEHHDCANKCCAMDNTNVAACVQACPRGPRWP